MVPIPRLLTLLGLVLFAFLLAGCSGGFSAGDDDDSDGSNDVSGGGEVNVDDEDNDSPGVGLAAIGAAVAAAGYLARRRA